MGISFKKITKPFVKVAKTVSKVATYPARKVVVPVANTLVVKPVVSGSKFVGKQAWEHKGLIAETGLAAGTGGASLAITQGRLAKSDKGVLSQFSGGVMSMITPSGGGAQATEQIAEQYGFNYNEILGEGQSLFGGVNQFTNAVGLDLQGMLTGKPSQASSQSREPSTSANLPVPINTFVRYLTVVQKHYIIIVIGIAAIYLIQDKKGKRK